MATVSPTKKVQSIPHIGSNVLMAVNTRKIGRIIEVELTKGPENFGFSVTTRDNPIGGNYPIYIKNILPKVSSLFHYQFAKMVEKSFLLFSNNFKENLPNIIGISVGKNKI